MFKELERIGKKITNNLNIKDMTRGEEIVKEAELCASANTLIIGDWGEHYLGFIHGAEWADCTMIDKACEWLYDHLYTRRDEQSPTNHFVCSKQEMLTQTEFVEQFRKAMESGCSEFPNNCEKGGEE